jgi:signal transduction histidine kinase/PleD family two-component response regulator
VGTSSVLLVATGELALPAGLRAVLADSIEQAIALGEPFDAALVPVALAPPLRAAFPELPVVLLGAPTPEALAVGWVFGAVAQRDEAAGAALQRAAHAGAKARDRQVASDRSARRTALMVESMADGVILTDDKSEVVLVNAAARRMLGIPPEVTITAKYLIDTLGFYPFDLVSRVRSEHEELRWGKKVLHSIVSPVGKQEGVVVVLRDVTDWKELDQRKEEFVSVVSHELRTPLTSIAGALDIVLKEYAGGLSEKQRRYLGMARESCARLNTIVDDLLDVARFERGKLAMQFDPVRLEVLAEECVERFRPAAGSRGVVISLRRHGDARIVGDADRLTQVMHNLLSNAIKFTPEGGEVEVEVFGAQVASSHVGVSVWNNGESIPEEHRERIFEKFEQVSSSATRRVGGTGLGLAISRSIVEGHGGRIWVEETPVGTKFVLTLPGAPDLGRREIEPIAPEETAPTGREVLVVDDDRYAAYLLKGVLMSAGHKVHVALDAEDAMAQARIVRPDLVTVDIDMPGGDGLALLDVLRHDPETRKAALVVISQRTDLAPTLGDVIVTKPLDLERFRESTSRLLTERGRGDAARVLVVDDDPGIRMICREVLENAGLVVREAGSGTAAVAEARRFRPDLILLDVMMPDQDGFQTATQLRAEPGAAMMPVIFVSARGQTADKVRAFKLGAEDYLVKPFDSAELLARVEKALFRRDREIGVSPTTRLPGAGVIEVEIERRLAMSAPFAFCYVDLDNLKAFNDHYGIARADAVIRQTGDLLREAVLRVGGAGDFVGHIAGDDFVLITHPDRLDRIAEHLCGAFDRLVPLYYEKVDRDRGFIEAEDRFGVHRQFAIMSVSLAALTVGPGLRKLGSYAEVAQAAAEAKQLAKALPGTSYVRDGQVMMLPERVTA